MIKDYFTLLQLQIHLERLFQATLKQLQIHLERLFQSTYTHTTLDTLRTPLSSYTHTTLDTPSTPLSGYSRTTLKHTCKFYQAALIQIQTHIERLCSKFVHNQYYGLHRQNYNNNLALTDVTQIVDIRTSFQTDIGLSLIHI